SKF
ncbi:unnamed protein product, partial [Allacma fusca]